ncbi:hypothetical protein [Haloarchaeobius sp. HME9146]|uniref:hypothetical protein n=1 Tax=Haloarchaeobius sp. HME9146 TaxID=2978732 RepID=UPI0021C0F00B|nr:hypothetical protein [Haloarchaeobius sp. HME9146]MCT9095343.1 hypothetical protein [Haloarchaeobius sp. HME9146]
MKPTMVPRRGFLARLAAGAGTVGAAGCLGGFGGTKYTFTVSHAADSLAALTEGFVETDPTEIHAQQAIDYSAEYKRSVVETLLDQGTAEAVQWQLAYDREFGTTTRPEPRFIVNDGTYHSVEETDRTEFTEDRWVFYLDLVDEKPGSGDTVVTEAPPSLSETDQLLVRRAREAVTGHGSFYDVDDEPLQGRGPAFHHEMDPGASDLVPSAPFDYFRRGDQYLVPRAERGPVDLTRYTFGIEEVASSRAELEAHVESTVVDAVFDRPGLDTGAVDILRDVTGNGIGGVHSESGQLSDGLAQLADRLGMTPYIPENPGQYTSLTGARFSFDDRWWRGSLSIRSTPF